MSFYDLVAQHAPLRGPVGQQWDAEAGVLAWLLDVFSQTVVRRPSGPPPQVIDAVLVPPSIPMPGEGLLIA